MLCWLTRGTDNDNPRRRADVPKDITRRAPIGASLTLTIDQLPEALNPTTLARRGEFMALEANGPSDDHPSPQAWARAGVAVSQMLRDAKGSGIVGVDLLVCLVACSCEPALDESTPARKRLISEHKSVLHEWFHGAPEPEEAGR
jgi:hypothetical protein